MGTTISPGTTITAKRPPRDPEAIHEQLELSQGRAVAVQGDLLRRVELGSGSKVGQDLEGMAPPLDGGGSGEVEQLLFGTPTSRVETRAARSRRMRLPDWPPRLGSSGPRTSGQLHGDIVFPGCLSRSITPLSTWLPQLACWPTSSCGCWRAGTRSLVRLQFNLGRLRFGPSRLFIQRYCVLHARCDAYSSQLSLCSPHFCISLVCSSDSLTKRVCGSTSRLHNSLALAFLCVKFSATLCAFTASDTSFSA